MSIFINREGITLDSKIQVSVENKQFGSVNATFSDDNMSVELLYPCSNNKCTNYNISLDPGLYRFELWGASGGYNDKEPEKGGHGAYTSGNLILYKKQSFYIYLGSKGCYLCQNGYNGGGDAPVSTADGYSASGGGASDIRLINGNWDNFDSLKSRIMVSSGGAGSVYYYGLVQGGHGGSLVGLPGTSYRTSCGYQFKLTNSSGGTQNSPGISSKHNDPGHGSTADAEFGKGGHTLDPNYGSGGGSGYFGGGSGSVVACHVSSGSGGSSFISGMNECNLFSPYSLSTFKMNRAPYSHIPDYKFSSPMMISGDKISYFGNGKARITLLDGIYCFKNMVICSMPRTIYPSIPLHVFVLLLDK